VRCGDCPLQDQPTGAHALLPLKNRLGQINRWALAPVFLQSIRVSATIINSTISNAYGPGLNSNRVLA
jgi:hypothetical protein